MIPIDTYEVWIILPYSSKKIWGGEDDILAIQAWNNARMKFTPNVDFTTIQLHYNSQGADYDTD